jgi:copper homeostasis protein
MDKRSHFLLEICCYSASDVLVAEQGGAQRVELCNGYEVGGTTPSVGNLILAKSLSEIPVYVMIRPRGGDFTYSLLEKKVMLKDIEMAMMNKADGIVFGALTEDGQIDKEFCKQIMTTCDGIPTTFHRAIDLCENPLEAIDFLASIGVQNILTSGGQIKAEQGIEQIGKMHDCAKNSIQIMAGSGVNAENILSFAKMGLTHFHSSASSIQLQNSQSDKISFNAALKNNELSVVLQSKVEAMVKQLNAFFCADEIQ